MSMQVFLGMPSAGIQQWIRDHAGPVVKPETHIKFVDGTEGDYLLEGNVDWQYLVGKGLVQQAGGPPEWIKKPQEVNFGSAVTSVGSSAFYQCTSLKSVTIPDSVTSIGNNAFKACADLTSVTIGSSVTSIGQDAFYQCTSLKSVTIPDSVTSIGQDAFSAAPSRSVTFSGKDKATVQGMANYSWGLNFHSILHCTDGDITI